MGEGDNGMSGIKSWSDKPFNEVPFCEPLMTKEDADAVWHQVISGWIGPGEKVKEFEEELGKYLRAKHVVCVNSGTTALHVAGLVLGQGDGEWWERSKTVLVPAYGVESVPNAFRWGRINPYYIDIDRKTGRMDPNKLAEFCEASPLWDGNELVCFVDFSGGIGEDLVAVRGICDEYGLKLIEDAACAMGHWFMDYHAGNWGHVGVLSFSVPKVLTTGQGGAVVTNDDEIAEKVRDYIDHGRFTGSGFGTNLRLTDIQAALGLSQLSRMGEILARKRLAHRAMRRKLGDYLFDTGSGVPLHNIVFSEAPDLLVERVREYGVRARRQYRCYDSTAVNARWWEEHAVYLPFGLRMNEDDGEYVGEAVLRTGVELVQP